MSDYYNKIANNFLNIYWLRHESALSHTDSIAAEYLYILRKK